MVVAAVAMSFMTWLRAEERAQRGHGKNSAASSWPSSACATPSAPLISPFQANEQETYTFSRARTWSGPGEPFDALTLDSISHRTQRVDAKQSDLAEIALYAVPDSSAGRRINAGILRLREGGTINDRFEVKGGR